MIFITIQTVAQYLLDLPWSIYSTFWLEESFGFNKTTPRTFVKDRLKAAALGAAIGLPLLFVILWLLESMGSSGWFWVWVTITVFQLVLMFLMPAYLLPLFLEMIPLPEGTVLVSNEMRKE